MYCIQPSYTLTLKKGDKLKINVYPKNFSKERWRRRTVHEMDGEYIIFKMSNNINEVYPIDIFDTYIQEGRVKKRNRWFRYKVIGK
jgi:hypothetical protein